MLIVKISPESNGAHASQMTAAPITPPDGYTAIPYAFEAATLSLLPWVKLTISDGVVTAVEDDTEARAAWVDTPNTATQIAALKSQLAATDYKVIKCAECQLTGEALPYDIAALHAERQAIRDQINALEA